MRQEHRLHTEWTSTSWTRFTKDGCEVYVSRDGWIKFLMRKCLFNVVPFLYPNLLTSITEHNSCYEPQKAKNKIETNGNIAVTISKHKIM